MDRVKEFLDSDRKIFLLLGDSGAGKSTFSRELEFDLWQSYETKTGRIPLYIDLPTIDKPEHDLITKQLRKAEFSESQIREMKHHREFILICDGYDECHLKHNLYMSNQLNQPREWNAKMMISCRSEYDGPDYRDQFQPGDRNHRLNSPLFQEAVLTPFSLDQVQDYIKQYVTIHRPQWRVDEYEHVLDVTPGLKDLVTNPFMMVLSLDVLPQMMDPGQQPSDTRITRVVLYDQFVEQWLKRGTKRLIEMKMSSQSIEAFKRLRAEGFTLNGIGYMKKFAVAIYKEQDGPVVEYSESKDKGSWKDDLFRGKENQLLREACLLKREGTQHQFIHQSLLEYALARAVFDPEDRRNRPSSKTTNVEQEPDPSSPLVWRNFVKNHSLLKFLEERVQQGLESEEQQDLEFKEQQGQESKEQQGQEFKKQQGQEFKNQLLAYIKHSKRDKKWSTAAANAITILIRAGVRFNGNDFSGIRIPEADLSYGMFDSVQFQGADMREVNLRGAWLRQSDLSKADMTGVQFGELPNYVNGSYIASCAYSPDGESFAVGFFSGVITVRSTKTWSTTHTQKVHGKSIDKIVFSREGGRVAFSCDKTIWLWDLESGGCHTLSDHAEEVICFAYSRQGDRFASSDGRTLRLWDPAIGLRTLSGHDTRILCVAFSFKGHQIASGSEDSSVRLWNVETGECSHIFMGHTQRVLDIAFSPRGDKVASSSADTTIRLWDTQTGGTSKAFVGHADVVHNIAFSEEGDQIASGSWDTTVRVWDTERGTFYERSNQNMRVIRVVWSSSGYRIASVDTSRKLQLWDISNGASSQRSGSHSQGVNMVQCSPKGDLIATCSLDTTIRLWDPKTGVCNGTLSGHKKSVTSIAFSPLKSPQGNHVASGSADKTVRLWDLETGACRRVFSGHTEGVNGIAYSPKRNQVTSVSTDRTVRLWDVASEGCEVLEGHTEAVTSVAYSPNEDLIVTGSKDNTLRLWDVGSRTCRFTLEGHAHWVFDVAFSPKEHEVASASVDQSVRLWTLETGKCRLKLTGHDYVVNSVAYSREADLLASGSLDNTVRLWDVATGQCLRVIQNLQGGVQNPGVAVAWDVHLDVLVTGCQDGSVLKWAVTKKERPCRVDLCWTAANGSLNVTGASIKGARGLSSLNKQLLMQRGIGMGVEYWWWKGMETISLLKGHIGVVILLCVRLVPLGCSRIVSRAGLSLSSACHRLSLACHRLSVVVFSMRISQY